jgi:hydroxymethylglutaryl-CoA synthase
MTGLLDVSSYLPACVLALDDVGRVLGQGGGRGSRRVANYDEDTTTMGVEAARLLTPQSLAAARSLWFASTAPAYGIKTNAAAIHAALGFDAGVGAYDAGGSLRSGLGAVRSAWIDGGVAVLSDMWSGMPGSDDERNGGDAAVACAFGDDENAIARIDSWTSFTMELQERWAAPGADSFQSWDDRFGAEAIAEVAPAVAAALASVAPSALVVSSANPRAAAALASLAAGAYVPALDGVGFAGVADVGLKLIAALVRATAGQRIALLVAGDGLEMIVLTVTDRIGEWQARRSADAADVRPDVAVQYGNYLTWRGRLNRQLPRRPEPQQPAAPPSHRNVGWKFGLVASRCAACGTVHTPPEMRCRGCGSNERQESLPLRDTGATVVTFTVDNLAYTPAPPLILAVVDFGNGARSSFEVADTAAGGIAIGDKVEMVFRRITSVGGVHNYFWKVRPVTT